VHVFDLGRYLEKVADLGGEEVPAEEETLTFDWDGRRPVEDSVVLEVAWVGNGVNRNPDDGTVLVFDWDDFDSFVRSRGGSWEGRGIVGGLIMFVVPFSLLLFHFFVLCLSECAIMLMVV
jgi:hypothetical protein